MEEQVNYVVGRIQKGDDLKSIKNDLYASGWSVDDVNRVFDQASQELGLKQEALLNEGTREEVEKGGGEGFDIRESSHSLTQISHISSLLSPWISRGDDPTQGKISRIIHPLWLVLLLFLFTPFFVQLCWEGCRYGLTPVVPIANPAQMIFGLFFGPLNIVFILSKWMVLVFFWKLSMRFWDSRVRYFVVSLGLLMFCIYPLIFEAVFAHRSFQHRVDGYVDRLERMELRESTMPVLNVSPSPATTPSVSPSGSTSSPPLSPAAPPLRPIPSFPSQNPVLPSPTSDTQNVATKAAVEGDFIVKGIKYHQGPSRHNTTNYSGWDKWLCLYDCLITDSGLEICFEEGQTIYVSAETMIEDYRMAIQVADTLKECTRTPKQDACFTRKVMDQSGFDESDGCP